MHACHEITVARAQAKRPPAEHARAGGAAMRCLYHRQHGRAPALRAQTRGELDVFVVGEEALVEETIAYGRAAVQRGRRGDAPGHVEIRADWQAVADLAKGAVADVDAR